MPSDILASEAALLKDELMSTEAAVETRSAQVANSVVPLVLHKATTIESNRLFQRRRDFSMNINHVLLCECMSIFGGYRVVSMALCEEDLDLFVILCLNNRGL